MSGWQAVSDQVLEIRARWRDAPAKLGPFSRHPRSVELLRHARADVLALLGEVDSTQGDPTADLYVELARLGAVDVSCRPVRALRGSRGRYRVEFGPGSCAVEAHTPAAALRLACRTLARAHKADSDRLVSP